jgi:glutamate dehydrogenase
LQILNLVNPGFVKLLSPEALKLALDLLTRPSFDEFKDVEIVHEHDWQIYQRPSLQILISVSLTRLNPFLFQVAKVIERRALFLRRVNATHVGSLNAEGRLLIVLGVHGAGGKPVWETTSIPELVQELSMLRLHPRTDLFETHLIETGIIKGHLGHFVRSSALFCHQMLASFDSDVYNLPAIYEALCRHPELTRLLVELFEKHLHPLESNQEAYAGQKEEISAAIKKIDTGQPLVDQRQGHILMLTLNFIDCILKTNFWRPDKLGLSYRIDPAILDRLPYKRHEKFSELPFAIFFHMGSGTLGFHIRFRDLARGGLRSILPRNFEQHENERCGVFLEAYNLALTQQKKNKDIPEGGAKAVILCEPYNLSLEEKNSLKISLASKGLKGDLIQEKLLELEKNKQAAFLYLSQKAFIESLLVLVNCHEDGSLKARYIKDYWKKPEYIFLGPDENMHNSMIVWIEQFSRAHKYRPGGAFISSHPTYGINHKEHGVTSLGVHTYLKEGLKHLGIDPFKKPFTIKMSGGPDGDVAGNELVNLWKDFPKTAKLIALTDASGTISDPEGLDLELLSEFFSKEQAICHYPPSKISEGGFLLDRTKLQQDESFSQKTLFWKKEKGVACAHWINSSEANWIFRKNIHTTVADVFITGGGRPRTLHQSNIEEFHALGKPTAKLIVEGANLYLTQEARSLLEAENVLIFRDSSANKGGVMSSSMEVLFRLCLEPQEILELKSILVQSIMQTIEMKAQAEAQLLLNEQKRTGRTLCELSQEVSESINTITDQIRDHLMGITLSQNIQDPLIQSLIHYIPKQVRNQLTTKVLQLPDSYKKAMIACHLACQLVYQRGLDWKPSIVTTLPLLLEDAHLTGNFSNS